jgi:POT family proton-dependent oligopeptide transporter
VPGGVEIPKTWFQSVNPFLVFTVTPVLMAIWTRQARSGREPTALGKMASGAAILAVAYLGLSLVCQTSGDAPVHWMWPMLFLAIVTLGELHILPIGLGLFGRLAPARLMATVLAAWYLTSFVGNLSAGLLGSYWTRLEPASFFALAAGVAAVSALILTALRAPARRLEAQPLVQPSLNQQEKSA